DLQLSRWTKSIVTWLTHTTLDPEGSKRVTMDHLTRLVTSALRRSYEQGGSDVDANILAATAERMILRRDEIVEISGLPSELARLYAVADPQIALLSHTSFSFRLCPTCVAEERRLSRSLVLPHITACLRHRIILVSTCQCGTALRAFHRQATPFACPKCRLD